MNDVPDDDPDVPDDGDDLAGFDLLGVAARELIGAARRVLDAVEQVVDDPDSARGAGAAMSDIVRRATRVGASFFASPPGSRPAPDDDEDGDEDGDGGVQFIKID